MTMDAAQFDSRFGDDRSDCSGGRRFLYALPDGSAYRCPHLDSSPIGSVLDPSFLEAFARDADLPYPCLGARCVAACGGLFSEQGFPDGTRHVGVDPAWKGLVGKNYLVLHVSVTHVCNYSCSYCSSERWMTEHAQGRKHVFTPEELTALASWAVANFEAGTVVVYGGEPTVHPGLGPFVSTFVGAGWVVDLLTNLHLGRRVVKLFEDLRAEARERLRVIFAAHVHQPGFSLQGARETLEKIRALAPRADLVVVYVNHQLNRDALSLEDLMAATRHVVTEYARNEDIYAKVGRLDRDSPSSGTEDCLIPGDVPRFPSEEGRFDSL